MPLKGYNKQQQLSVMLLPFQLPARCVAAAKTVAATATKSATIGNFICCAPNAAQSYRATGTQSDGVGGDANCCLSVGCVCVCVATCVALQVACNFLQLLLPHAVDL